MQAESQEPLNRKFLLRLLCEFQETKDKEIIQLPHCGCLTPKKY